MLSQNIEISPRTAQLLRTLADRYETADFLDGDPSWFMHQVSGTANREVTAFLASCLSFGSRAQFLPKIQWLLDRAGGDMDTWVRSGSFAADLRPASGECFYRMCTEGAIYALLDALRRLLRDHDTLGGYVAARAATAHEAVVALTQWFAGSGAGHAVPAGASSACKRLCMFLRWMVRSGSPVDLGLWAHFIDRRTLIMPLDTHVLQQAEALGLMRSRTATMSAARRLTAAVAQVFPDDPLRADFALFGYGVNSGDTRKSPWRGANRRSS